MFSKAFPARRSNKKYFAVMCEVIHRQASVCTVEDEVNRDWLRRVSGARHGINHDGLSAGLFERTRFFVP
jgi:hypothetical protein